jgi:hypothetical protein
MCLYILAFYECRHRETYSLWCTPGGDPNDRRNYIDAGDSPGPCPPNNIGVGRISFPWLCANCSATAGPGERSFRELGHRVVRRVDAAAAGHADRNYDDDDDDDDEDDDDDDYINNNTADNNYNNHQNYHSSNDNNYNYNVVPPNAPRLAPARLVQQPRVQQPPPPPLQRRPRRNAMSVHPPSSPPRYSLFPTTRQRGDDPAYERALERGLVGADFRAHTLRVANVGGAGGSRGGGGGGSGSGGHALPHGGGDGGQASSAI